MRVAVVILLVANLAFFVWTQGWVSPWLPAPWQGQREPQRLLEQLHPERVAVRRAAGASQPPAGTTAAELTPAAASAPAAAPASSPSRSGP